MRVKVRYFASLRDLLGVREEEYEVEGEPTVRELILEYVLKRHENVAGAVFEKLEGLLRGEEAGYMIIVNGDRADPARKLRSGDVVAILPPVGGG
ncbi:MAG: molybdopterin synthase sulfur carrier subunit [Thaumarchaeota archaeon]|nr:MAG: molybdopterin synthase sulfur carrier subunit [Nitrososphaerota archaeon]HDD66225.1 MoaD/ThiS family protein [Nitrososphaeria archaeon]